MAKTDFATQMEESDEIARFRERRFILYPKHWKGYHARNPLVWTRKRFELAQAVSIPDDQLGVYSFVAEPLIADHPACHYLLYVGSVDRGNLQSRFRDYLAETAKEKPRPHIYKMIARWQEYLWFYYVTVPNAEEALLLEDELITAYLPPTNRRWPATISASMRGIF